MTIKVKYFASLREEIGRPEDELRITTPLTAMQVWTQATGREHFVESLLIALNQEYVSADVLVKDGDELAFFPPVTGG